MASRIEWTGSTWNPIVGCSVLSPGCKRCYAMRMARRQELMSTALGRVSHYVDLTKDTPAGPVWTGEMRLVESALDLPLRTTKPTTWFVNSMSDLFHEGVQEDWLAAVFNVMAETPQHTYQVLTKRSARMRMILNGPKRHNLWSPKLWHRSVLPNVWLGVSAEDQRRADARVPDLLATPAAIRFVSAEPLIGPIDFTHVGTAPIGKVPGDALRWPGMSGPSRSFGNRLDWIIVGGESGPGAWIDEQLATAQGCAPGPEMFDVYGRPKGQRWHFYDPEDRLGGAAIRVGKKAAGRLLDGRVHDALPELRT